MGCLATPEPPTGQHVVLDRTLSNVFLSPSETDGVPSYLVALGPERPYRLSLSDPSVYEVVALAGLYMFPYASSPPIVAGLSGVQPIDDSLIVSENFGGGYKWSYVDSGAGAMPSDYRGFVWYDSWSWDPGWEITRNLDLNKAIESSLGSAGTPTPQKPFFVTSPNRYWAYSKWTLWDLDPAQIAQTGAPFGFPIEDYDSSVVFVGDDCYLTDSSGQLKGFKTTGGRPDSGNLVYSFAGQISLVPILGDLAPQLLLTLKPAQGLPTFALLDTQSLRVTPLLTVPQGSEFMSASDDGHWLLFGAGNTNSGGSDAELILIDWTTSRHDALDASRLGRALGSDVDWPAVYADWRPGHEELWFPVSPGGVAIWKPDGTLAFFDRAPARYSRKPSGIRSMFTGDGRHWFAKDTGQAGRVAVGSADDPAGAVFFLNPVGTGTLGYWPLDDGRLLVEASPVDSQRSDIYLVDPDVGASRAVASAGHVVTTGRGRLLAFVDWELERSDGELALVDLSSGIQTVFAQDVYAVAVDRGKSAIVPSGTDALAPGTTIAFLTRGRLESPYDGLWVTKLP